MKAIMIVGISGKRGTGKSTLAELVRLRHGWNHLSLATPIKDLCKAEFGFNKAQTDGPLKEAPIPSLKNITPREVMIRLGRAYREINENFWINKLEPKMQPYIINIISDVRFKNEATWIKERGGWLIRLEREPALTPYEGEIKDASETELDEYDFHCILPAEHNKTMDQIGGFADFLSTHIYMNRGGLTGPHGRVYQGC